ncbi:MAG: diguanylate cyclase [Jatrophihabitantaceae bacterium]
MLGLQGARRQVETSWQPCYELAAHQSESALDEHARCIEERLYYSLNGLVGEATALAEAARQAGRDDIAGQAELIAIEVRSRCGEATTAKAELLAMLDRVPPQSALAGRTRLVLATTVDRLGERTEAGNWIRQALAGWPDGQALHWRAEALMVSALIGMSRTNVDYALVHHAAAEISAHGDRLLLAATLANFAEVSAECGDLAISAEFADAVSALLRRHPELSSTLTLDSIGRSRLALGELTTAHYCLEYALDLEQQLHCTDVLGDPWLTFAEIKLALGQPDEAWALLEHPRRTSWAAKASWVGCRDLKLRARVLAAQQRWQPAYQAILEHLEIYERLRSVEGDRAVTEISTVQLADEERRRAAEFEKLALTDPLTGIANRRRVERWLAAAASRVDLAGRDDPACQTVALAILDLDHFKRVNDSYSHDSGDEVLRRVALALEEVGTGPDLLVARLGGEEFVQLSRGTSRAEAIRLAEQLLLRLRTLTLDEVDADLRITASIGLAFGDPAEPSELLRAADRCLYAAKRAGRDQIVVEPAPSVDDPAEPAAESA